MDAKLINPFINATLNVLKTMAHVDAAPGKPTVKLDNRTWGDVTGIIGMAGEKVSGTMAISFEQTTILYAVSKMLMEEFTQINQDVVDAVGEITNMICGGTKKDLAEAGYKFDMAIPMIISGKGVEVKQMTASPILVIPFTSGPGSFVVEANLVAKKN